MTHRVTLIPGDGIGPEVVSATRCVLEACPVEIEWDVQEAGSEYAERSGDPLPESVLESVRRNRVALKGPITTPLDSSFRSINATLRKELDLYACIRPCRTLADIPIPVGDVNFVVVRECHEGLFSGIEYQAGSDQAGRLYELVEATHGKKLSLDTGVSLKTISRTGTERVARAAFEYARSNGRSKVTVAHKANVMKSSDGLFVETVESVATDYPDIELESCFIDYLCSDLVRRPARYDVLVLPNLYGDIVSDLGAGLTGGVGLAAGANIGEDCAVFEAGHGSAPKYRGLGKANPLGLILTAALMLKHLGEDEVAAKIERAVDDVVSDGVSLTYDLARSGEPVSTLEAAQAVAARLDE